MRNVASAMVLTSRPPSMTVMYRRSNVRLIICARVSDTCGVWGEGFNTAVQPAETAATSGLSSSCTG